MSKATAASEQFKFRALLLANEQRNAYGLRYNDHSRYRKHCANKTHRLRSTLKMTHGKGRDFKKLPFITSENIKDGHLQLLLFEAERAWSYSQELYASSLLPANADKASTLRHSATGRFRRAVHWATQLLSHCQTLHAAKRLSSEGFLHATAYTLILNGRFLRFRDDFEDGLAQLCVARSLLDALSRAARTSRDQALATLFADEVAPEIRYCAHELGHKRSYDVDGIVAEVAPRHREALVEGFEGLLKQLMAEGAHGEAGESPKQLKALVWEGKEIPVRNPELVDVLLKVQEAEARLCESQADPKAAESAAALDGKKFKGGHKSRRGVAAYDGILSTLSDADDVARKLLEAQQASGATTPVVPGTRDIHFLHSYIVYQLLARRIQRDLTLVSALLSTPGQRPNQKIGTAPVKNEQTDARVNPAVVKLLDTVLQSLTQMRTLNVVDESQDLANAVEARIAFTKSRRCLYLSRTYSAVKKYAEALSLTQRCHLYFREASSLLMFGADPITNGTPAFYPLAPTAFSELETTLAEDEGHYKRDWFTFNGGSVSASRSAKKPLFFDIALNYAELDMVRLQERAGSKKMVAEPASVVAPTVVKPKGPIAEHKGSATKAKAEEIERAATPEPAPARGGISNLLGGWWGRK